MHCHLPLAALAIGLLTLLVGCGGDAPPVVEASDQWRATDATLADRVERLATAGEADAALGVFAELATRPGNTGSPAEQRARLALVRALVVLGRNDDALVHLHGISWADKSPNIATQVLGLEARLRWQQLTVDGAVVSGAIPAIAAADAPHGEPQGPWLARHEAYTALAGVLDRGGRLVRAEGGTPELPATAEQLILARYAFGDRTRAELATGLGDAQHWTPELALAMLRVQLAEHEIDDAAAIAGILWDRHTAAPEAAEAFRLLRVWQLLRQRAGNGLRLWTYPELDERLASLISTWPAAEQAARAELAVQQDVNTQAVVAERLRSTGVHELVALADGEEPVEEHDEEPPEARQFLLAQSWPGLSLVPAARIVAAGTSASVSISSEHRGEHRLSVWRLPDATAYDLLARDPTRTHLPATPLSERQVTVAPWSSLGESHRMSIDLGLLDEGFYAVSVTARGCPVVVVSGFTVCDVDLHTVVGSDELVAWVVRRADGCGKAGEPLRAEFILVRDPASAAGEGWKTGDDAWRAGFRAAFLGIDDLAWKGAGDQPSFAAGKVAGTAAAQQDPPRTVVLTAVSDAQGVARWPVPTGFTTRGWKAQVRVERPQIAVSAAAEHQALGGWDAVCMAWADKPVVRPGETLRFKAVLRDWDGEIWHRPEGTMTVVLACGTAQLFTGELPVSDVGTIAGAVTIPPGCDAGQITLRVRPDATSSGPAARRYSQTIAEILDQGLPLGTLRVFDDGETELRAGETRVLRVSVRDAAGEPLAACAVKMLEAAVDLDSGKEVPGSSPTLLTDASGEIVVRIPTARDSAQVTTARFTATIAGQRFVATSSWTTRTFPLPLAVELRQRTIAIGDVLRARIKLPQGASVQVGLILRSGKADREVTVSGTGGWTDLTLPITTSLQGSTVLRFTASELGGGQAHRDLAVTITPAPAAADDPVRCLVATSTVVPGSDVTFTMGTTLPGRDLLLVGGTGEILVTKVVHLADPALSLSLPVAADWAPNLGFKALAWLPGRGFTASARQDITVLPVDRLLSVVAQPELDEYRPSATATIALAVTDWKQQPVAGASLSVALVDERLFALGEDRTPDLLEWFTKQRLTWSLGEASAIDLRDPQMQLWRAVARRWSGTAGALASGMGRVKGYGGSACSRSSSTESSTPVIPEADPTIHWSADLRTDAAGHATVALTLPGSPGRFRITARANDRTAAVLVGEVRGLVVVREPLTAVVSGPQQAVDGDEVTLTAEVTSRLPAEVPVRLRVRCEGTTEVLTERSLTLSVGLRKSVPLSVVVHLPATGELRRVGDLLGRAVRLNIEIQPPAGEPAVLVHHDVLLALPGTPTVNSLRLVADAAGKVPQVIAPAGAAVWLRLRAWPDAAARRRAELLAWRSAAGARGALAWLLAEPGQVRSNEVARRWQGLGTDPAAMYVRLVARRLSGTGSTDLGELANPAGPWLLAYGRSLGLQLPVSAAMVDDDDTTACAAAAIALREATPGAGRRWLAAHDQLGETSPALAWAFALDAAMIAGDAAMIQQIQAELASREWTDDLTAVIAADLLPATGSTAAANVVLHQGDSVETLSGAEWTQWTGVVADDLRLSAVPGALIAADVVVQRVDPEHLPTVRLLRRWSDGAAADRQFVELPAGSPVELGEQLTLEIRGASSYVLPALLQLSPQGGDIIVVDRFEETWQRSDVPAAAERRQFFTEMNSTRRPVGGGRHADGAADVVASGGRRIVRAGLVLVEPRAIGRCTVGGGVPLTVVSELPPEIPEVPFPLSKELQASYDAGAPEEQAMLLTNETLTLTQWRELIDLCDPARVDQLTLEQLLRHPLCGRRGHRTTVALRRWIDHEPLFDDLATSVRNPINRYDPVALAVLSRDQRRQALAHQPFPAPIEITRTQPLRAWHARFRELGLIDPLAGQSLEDWCWSLAMSRKEFADLGYGKTAEEWVRFLDQEFAIHVRLGRGVPGGVPQDVDLGDQFGAPDGERLGFDGLAKIGLQLVSLPDGLELRSIAEAPVVVSLVVNDLPLAGAIDRLNQQLVARGLPTVLYDPPVPDHTITLSVRDMKPRYVLEFLTKLTGCTLENYRGRPRLVPKAGPPEGQ